MVWIVLAVLIMYKILTTAAIFLKVLYVYSFYYYDNVVKIFNLVVQTFNKSPYIMKPRIIH